MTEERHPREIGMQDVPKNLQPYFLGLLRRGPRWNEIEGPEAAELLPRHLKYWREQSEAGRYVAAGPVLEAARDAGEGNSQTEYAGMLLIAAATLEAARALIEGDPAIRAGRLDGTLYPVLLPSLDGVRAVYGAEKVSATPSR